MYLMSANSHPTAETIYTALQKEFPNISLGTVYRNLNFLVEHGEAVRLDVGDGSEHFDADTTPHHHFYCRHCKCVMDLKMNPIDHIDLIAGAGFDGTIEGHTIFFYGLCPDCRQNMTHEDSQ